MGEEELSPGYKRLKKSRAWKRKRIKWLKDVFSYRSPKKNSKKVVASFQLTGHEVDFIEQIRSAHDSHMWKYIPNDVFQFLLDGNLRYDENEIEGPDVEMVSNKGLVLMGLRCLWLYLLGSSPYNGFLLREMHQVDGKEMNREAIKQRVNRGRLYSQIEELGASLDSLTDEDFEFDDADWDSL